MVIGVFVFFNTLKPDYSGNKTLAGLQSEVKVYFDPYGIPHIYAESEIDCLEGIGLCACPRPIVADGAVAQGGQRTAFRSVRTGFGKDRQVLSFLGH